MPVMDQEKVKHVVNMRLAYDKVNREVRANDDPDGARKLGAAAGAWLDLERELTTPEFELYMELWRAQRVVEK